MTRENRSGAKGRRPWLTRRRILFLAVFAVAIALRVAYLVQIQENVSFQIISLDSDLYDQRALEILRSDFWGRDVFYSAPLYPYFLALVYAVAGPSFAAVRVVQIVLGSLTAVLVVLYAERTFGSPVSWIAGFVAALYAPFVFSSATILGTTLAVFLVTLGLVLFSRTEAEGRRRDALMLLSGVAIGLACLLRPNMVLVLPLWVVSLAALSRGTRWIRPSIAFLVGGALVVAPVTARNAVVGRDFVPISSHGGVNFWIGNHPGATGTFDLPPGIRGTPEQVNLIDSTRLATQAAGRNLKPSEVSAFWFQKGWAYIRENPGESAGLLVRKVRMFWNRIEIPLNVNFHFLERSSPFLRIPLMHFGLISPLALLGIGLTLRRWRTLLPAHAVVIATFAGGVAFFVSGRYRLPVVPILIVLASYALWWLVRAARQRRWGPLAVAGGIGVALAVHANVPVEGFDVERSFARDHYYLAVHYRSQQQLDLALRHYEESLRRNPDFWLSYNGRGVCLAEIGRLDEAVASFRKAIDLVPTRAEPWTNLGIALATHGRVEDAVPCWERALTLDPGDEGARTSLERARRLLEP